MRALHIEGAKMRTNIEIDDRLMREAMKSMFLTRELSRMLVEQAD